MNVGINTNAGSAESDGVEVSLMFRPVEQLKLSLTGAYTDAKLTEDADRWWADATAISCRTPRRSAIRRAPITIGRWPESAARTSALRSVTWMKYPPASDPAYVALNGGQRYLPAYDMFDVRAGMDFGKVSVEVFGRNLTNDEGKTSDAGGNTPNGAIVHRRDPSAVLSALTVTAEF